MHFALLRIGKRPTLPTLDSDGPSGHRRPGSLKLHLFTGRACLVKEPTLRIRVEPVLPVVAGIFGVRSALLSRDCANRIELWNGSITMANTDP